MKIAIVAPSPVPFGVGGAEKLWWGMLEFINKHTTHQCELIKVPTKEHDFWELIDSYYAFYNLDLSSFDMVITGKYPAWMIQHNNHHIYMLHCLRGFYDCYHFLGLQDEVKSKNKKIIELINTLKDQTTSIDEVFKLLFDLRKDTNVSAEEFEFPGVFIKKIIHFFDKKAMQSITKFSAISKTVANRKEYFPPNTQTKIIYPPSILTNFKNNSSAYFFSVSRLDGAKRIEMIVSAYLKSNTNIPLKIAGTGPLSDELKALTKNDRRIEMLGFISDDNLIKYYSNSYAVLFVPYDEDYGLITIEAMMCEKPVLTFSDSGGVLEFVENNVTGLVCKPSVKMLTKNINYLSNNPELCKKMGKEAKKRVSTITWKNTIESLINASDEKGTKSKEKITVVSTYGIYPPRGGGQNRIFYLYKELTKTMIVDVVCLVHESEKYRKTEIAPNFFEIRVPKTEEHAKKEWEIEAQAGKAITDIAMLYLYNETPLFKEKILESFKHSNFLIATHPYTYELCQSITENNLIYDSHNVEFKLKQQILKNTKYNNRLLKKLFEVEKKACLEAKFTTVCSYEDALTYEDIYGYNKSNTVVIPNGVDLNSVPYISEKKRKNLKDSLDLSNEKIILFIGSWHQPNIDAVKKIFNMALKLPHYSFIILGGVGGYFTSQDIPKNIGFTGVTSDEEKEMYLSIAYIAINPMLTGSGTNLKMLDYMANGIPVVSTKVGSRGLNIPSGYIVECNIDKFTEYMLSINEYVNIEKSRSYVENNFSWKIIGKKLSSQLMKSSCAVG